PVEQARACGDAARMVARDRFRGRGLLLEMAGVCSLGRKKEDLKTQDFGRRGKSVAQARLIGDAYEHGVGHRRSPAQGHPRHQRIWLLFDSRSKPPTMSGTSMNDLARVFGFG